MPRSLFPPTTIDDALPIARAIQEHNAGQPMRRVTIFDKLGRKPDSSTSRAMVTASAGYGLTKGNYTSEWIELTDAGKSVLQKNGAEAKVEAVLSVGVFQSFFANYKGASLPSQESATDYLEGQGLTREQAAKCLEVMLRDGREVGLIQEMSGKERIVSRDHALEAVRTRSSDRVAPGGDQVRPLSPATETIREPQVQVPAGGACNPALPTLHIDIQVHIAADAKPEQIEKVFESMARHLFGRTAEA